MALDPKHASPTGRGFAVMTHTHRGREIDVRTVAETERGAVVSWLAAGAQNHRPVMPTNQWSDEMILAEFAARCVSVGARVIPVHVMEAASHG